MRNNKDFSDRPVTCEFDGVMYRGRKSVIMSGKQIFIDGREFGVECDENGDDLPRLPVASLGPESRWNRFCNWLLRRGR